jgi:hypothetical protein
MQAQLLAYQCPHCGKMMEVEPTAGNRILTCPNPDCQKPFQLDVPRAQPAPALIVPDEAHEEAAQAPAARPVAQVSPLAEPELRVVRPTMFRRFPLRFVLLTVFAAGGLVATSYGLLTDWTLVAGIGVVAALYGLLRLLFWWLRTHNTVLTVTTRRCMLRTGVFAGQNVEMLHGDIHDAQVVQSWRDRLFDVGDLVLRGRDDKTPLLHVLGLPRADEIAGLIRSRHEAP